MDRANDRPVAMADGESNETLSRVVAYFGQYLFWTTVIGLSTGIYLLQ
ncbi:MAG: hypothetical protein GXP16_07155 [Gammaproteobacteria bacterium]|nr:hypothetical protein [Gammaproteobacteria bacterium]